MSFPRARIQRFNEFQNDAPPPGSYDPKIKSKVKGVFIEKTDRFQDSKSVSSSCTDCNSSTSSKSASISSTPTFKIPKLPKKKATPKTPQNLSSVKTNKKCDSNYDPTKELADLKVECVNKDKTIQEYEKQIDEMKEDIRKLEQQLAEIRQQQNEIEMRHKKDMDEIVQDRHLADIEMKTKVQKMHEDFLAEINKMKAEEGELKKELTNLAMIREELDSKLQNRQQMVIDLQSQLSMLECELDECRLEGDNMCAKYNDDNWIEQKEMEERHEQQMEELRMELEAEKEHFIENHNCQDIISDLEDDLQSTIDAKRSLENKLSKIKCLHSDVKRRLKEAEDELKEVKDHHSQVLKNHSQEIETLMSRHAEEISRLVKRCEEFRQESEAEREKNQELQAKSESTLSEARKSANQEVQNAIEKYTASLSAMEYQLKTAEDKLKQKEIEVTELSLQVEELKNSSATKESSNQSLQTELDRAEGELAEKKEEVKTLKDQLRNEAAQMVTRRRRLDLVMAENQATVSAISERLAKSDTEVERLQGELERERTRHQEHRDLLNTMRTNSQLAHDQMQNLLQQLDAKKEDIDQLVVDNMVKIDAMKSFFDAKINELNDIAAKEITRLQAECDKTSNHNKELRQQLAEMADKVREAQEMLLKVEEQYDARGVEVARLELSCQKLEKLYKESNKKYEESTAQLAEQKLAIDKAQSYIDEWTDKLEMMQEDKNHQKEYSLKTEQEKEKKIEAEQKIAEIEAAWKEETDFDDRNLLESNLRKIEAEYKELADKYAAVIGHNNHKQKIQHMLQMKKEKLQLKEDVEAARRIIAQQQRTIEKLRAEERNRQLSKEKENLPSSIVASPHKPSTPLKDRNV